MNKLIKNRIFPKVIKATLKVLFRVEVKGDYQGGQDNGHDSTLVIANHASFLDGILLALFLPDTPIFVVSTLVSKSWLFSFFLRYVDYLSVDPSHPMAMKNVVELLEKGRSVVIFPEGRITKTGGLMKVYGGAAFAATKANATIIPVHISGSRRTYFSHVNNIYPPRFFPKIRLTILPPTRIVVDDSISSHERHIFAKEKMHHLMMEMEVTSKKALSIYEQLLESRNQFGRNTLAYEDGITDDLTFNDLVKKSIALSVIFKKQGLPKRVGLMLPNSNPAVLTFYALQYMGKVSAMLNYTAGIRAIRAGLTACESDTILTSRIFIEKANLQALITELNELGEYRIIYLEDLRETLTVQDKITIFLYRNFPKFKLAKCLSTDESVVLFTSGSEGFPKGVVHSHESLLTNVAQLQAIYDVSPADKIMICLPMFHVFGLMAGALLPVYTGASAFLYPNPLHYKIIPEVIYDRDCTFLLSTSTFLSGYARFADPYDFRSLRYVIAGAEKLSDKVASYYQEHFGIRIMEGYGVTETAPVISANTSMSYMRGSVGRPLPNLSVDIIPVAGIETGGKLVIRSKSVMLGYLNADNPGVINYAKIVDEGREYDTGDIVDIDEKGFIHIKGRVKRFAKMAGEMISLDSVEKLAAQTSDEHYHAVVSIPDETKGEALILFTTDEAMTRARLQKVARTIGLPELAVPRDIRQIDVIPIFSSGKTNYPALSERVNNG